MKMQLYTTTSAPAAAPQHALMNPDVAAAPARAAAGAFGAAYKETQQWGEIHNELVRKEREAEDLVESMRLRTQFGQELAAADIEMRGKAGFDLGTHSEKLKERGNTILEGLAGQAKRPEVARLVKIHGTQALGSKVVDAQYEYRRNLSSKADAENLAAQRQTEVEAVEAIKSANPRQYLTVLEAYDQATTVLASQGHITQEQAGERRLAVRENVDSSLARDLISKDPYEAGRRLQDPKNFPNLRQSRRDSLIISAAHGVTSAESAERRKRTEAEHEAKQRVNRLGMNVLRSWDPSTPADQRMTREQVETALQDPEMQSVMSMETGAAIRRVMNSNLANGGEDGPGMEAQVTLGISMKDRKVTRESIFGLVGRGLSAKTAAKLIDDLDKENQEKGVRSKDQFKEASHYITRAMTGIDPMAGLMGGQIASLISPKDSVAYAAAHTSLYREARRLHERPGKGESLDDLLTYAEKLVGKLKNSSGGTPGIFTPRGPVGPPQQQPPASPREQRDQKRGFGG